jgi:hypothetical protein
MNADYLLSSAVSRAELEAAERAQAMTAFIKGLPGLFARLAAWLEPARQKLPVAGAWAPRRI